MIYLVFSCLVPSFLMAFNLSIDQDFAKITNNDIHFDSPFMGGFNKPKIQWIDWNNDGFDDLLLLDEDGHIKLYFSTVCNRDITCLELYSTNLLELSGVLWFFINDFDNDGNYDIITSDPDNSSYARYYHIVNNQIVDNSIIVNNQGNFLSFDPVMVPCFADIDNDGDLDLFSGDTIGTINFFENVGLSNNIPIFSEVETFWQEIYIVGSSFSQRHGASAINFIDLDGDNDLDLSWGDYFQQSLYIIWNEGDSHNPNMDNINILTQFPINDPIISAGLNMPTFTDIDNDNDMDLFITTLSGAYGYQLSNNFTFYEKQDDIFVYKTSNFIQTLDLLSDINPKFVDIDNDDDLDLFIGTDFDPSSFPWRGKVVFYENVGLDNYSNEPVWQQISTDFLNLNIGNNLFPEFIDIDGDDDFDLFVGEFNGLLHYFRNDGDSVEYNFSYQGEIEGIDLAGYSTPEFIDIDNDNDFDLLIGNINGNILLYENNGDQYNFNFSLVDENYNNINVDSRSSILSVDFDMDNDVDLLIGSGNNNIIYYENIGNNSFPDFIINNNIDFPTLGLNTSIDYFSSSNTKGIIVGLSTGGAYFLSINNNPVGDMNFDISLNIFDLILLVEFIIGNSIYDHYADLNQDGLVNIIDVYQLINHIISS